MLKTARPEWSFLICCGVLGLQAVGMMGVFLPGCWPPLTHIGRPTSSPDLHELDFRAMVLGSGTDYSWGHSSPSSSRSLAKY